MEVPEKFFNIVCRTSGIWPSAVVLVATCKAIKYHGGVSVEEAKMPGKHSNAFEKGLENLTSHIGNLKKFEVPLAVAVNKFEGDDPGEIDRIYELCESLGIA